jgi:hypothetical protein
MEGKTEGSWAAAVIPNVNRRWGSCGSEWTGYAPVS